MPVMKRATAKLRAAGLETLTIERGIYGYTAYDNRYKHQRSRCYPALADCLAAVEGGERPVEVRSSCSNCGLALSEAEKRSCQGLCVECFQH